MRNPNPEKQAAGTMRDVSFHLRHLLFEQDRVFLPGLGTFVTQSQEARRDPLAGSISPPSRSVQFNSNLFFDDGNLKRVLSRANDISVKAAARIVNDYVKELKQRLSQKSEARIPGVGVLTHDRSGQVQFIPADVNFSSEAFGLPRVHAQLLVGRPNLAPLQRPSIPITSQVKPAESSSWLVRNRALVGGAVFALVAIVFIVLLTRPDRGTPVMVTNRTPNVNVAPQKQQQEDVPTPPPPEAIERSEQIAEVVTPPPSEPVTRGGTAAPVTKKKTFVIILGNYQDLGAVHRIMVQLKELGYEPYTEAADGATTLGFKKSYSDESEVDEALQFAREEFGPDAFVMNK